ncbi:long-chain fatty acid transport protein 6 [Erpetoichthys calabaricus]|uniref:long-chain fatty acid transport protein 6 n=1 Tax=Erpetoichthys calabaricus TaxID=27687 RepID=UPI0022341038|nr:long-chain fatty acid transport protein 6 [Erpetoichthys calabaricus]
MLLPIITAAAVGLATGLLLQKMFYPYIWLDLIYYFKLQRVKQTMKRRMRQGVITLLDCFVRQAKCTPEKPFIIYEGEAYSYGDVERRSNKVAQVLNAHSGLQKGDTVALFISNEPDFICVWFGLAKLGCVVAFLNFNIKSRALVHCLGACGAKTVVVGADLFHTLEEILPSLLQSGIQVWLLAKSSSHQEVLTLLDKMEDASEEPLPTDLCSSPNIFSNSLYIFTSGTTGMPKAACISHLKEVMSMCFLKMCGVTCHDVVYITLPLYHMSASLLGIGGCIELGAACVLKKRFSASQFWNDCKKYNITVFQYVGELCRYLINQPKVPEETAHKVRLAAGSGLRPDVWKEFVKRFGNIKVVESYGLTESNIGFINYTDKIGPVGRASFINKWSLQFDFVKYDVEKEEPIRHRDGYCVKACRGETGLLITPVSVVSPFLGYAGNKEMSEKKLLRNVFKEGDVFFNTGDFMLIDQDDFVYFRDRTGDTFRWKGENVATTEVTDVLASLDFLQEVNVYGVSVPGHEGKAGMAAVILRPNQVLDCRSLYCHLKKHLPSYSWPRFIRIQESLDVTETFKQQKSKLVQEGFDLSQVTEPLYFLDESEETYSPLSSEVFAEIVSAHKRI